MDVAQLGLVVDSSQVKAAAGALANFTASAKPAASAAGAIEQASRKLSEALDDQVAKQNKLSKQTGLSRNELINFSRQAQDVGVSLASGQNPFTVLVQQGAQIFDIFASGQGTLRGFAGQIAAVITPARLLAGGLIAAGTAAVAATLSWKNFASQLDDTARIAGTTTTAMAQLQAAASFKGIDSAEFTKGVGSFSQQIYEARNNMGGLVDVLRSAGVPTVGDFATQLGRVADLIKRAQGDTQLQISILRQSGLPTTMEWVRFMEQGSAGIKRAAQDAVAFGGAANANMVTKAREFDEAWNKATTNWSYRWRSAVVEAGNLFDRLGAQATRVLTQDDPATNRKVGGNLLNAGRGTPLESNFDAFYSATGAKRVPEPGQSGGKKPPDPEAERKRIADMQAYLGLLGQTMTAEEARLQVQNQLDAAAANGIHIDKQRAEVLKQLTYEQQLGITMIKAQTDAYAVEAGAIGMSAGKTAEATAIWNRLNEAKRNHQVLTADNIEQIKREAGALGQAAQAADNARFGYETLRGTFQTFTSALAQGATLWDAFKKAGQSALNSIASKLADMATQGLWNAAFGGNSGSGGGASVIGSFFKGATGGTGAVAGVAHGGGVAGSLAASRYVHPAYFDDAPRFHGGGLVSDEVPIIAKKGEGVFTPEQMRALAPVNSAPSVVINNNYSFTGVEPGMEARLKSYIDQGDRRSVNQSVEAVARQKSNSPSYLQGGL